MKTPTTLKDLASVTGYSLMTVSAAVTGRGRLADETRDEIQAAAKRLNYTPNSAATLLRAFPRRPVANHRPRVIALFIEDTKRSMQPWIVAIQSLDCVAVVFVKDQSFSYRLFKACRPVGVVWFDNPPQGLPFPVTRGIGNPLEALRKLC